MFSLLGQLVICCLILTDLLRLRYRLKYLKRFFPGFKILILFARLFLGEVLEEFNRSLYNRSTLHVIDFKASFCLYLKPDWENSPSTQGGIALWNEHARLMLERFFTLEFLFVLLNSSLQNLRLQVHLFHHDRLISTTHIKLRFSLHLHVTSSTRFYSTSKSTKGKSSWNEININLQWISIDCHTRCEPEIRESWWNAI